MPDNIDTNMMTNMLRDHGYMVVSSGTATCALLQDDLPSPCPRCGFSADDGNKCPEGN